MTRPHPLVDLSCSYLEVDGWIIIDLNRKTGSIHMYEDYELSAESFLAEVNTLPIIPSLRMPFPSMANAKELQSKETQSDQLRKSSTKGVEAGKLMYKGRDNNNGNAADEKNCLRPRASSDVEPLSPREKTAQRWAEIKKILTASLDDDEDDNEENPFSKENLETENDPDSPKSVYVDLDNSSGREGSESPHTDPDFVHSSSDSNDAEWVLGTEMAGLKVSDSLLMVESNGISSVTGELDAVGKEAGARANKDDDDTGNEKYNGNETTHKEDGTRNDKEVRDKGKNRKGGSGTRLQKVGRDERRKETRNISLAAGVTTMMVAAIWMLERKYDLA